MLNKAKKKEDLLTILPFVISTEEAVWDFFLCIILWVICISGAVSNIKPTHEVDFNSNSNANKRIDSNNDAEQDVVTNTHINQKVDSNSRNLTEASSKVTKNSNRSHGDDSKR